MLASELKREYNIGMNLFENRKNNSEAKLLEAVERLKPFLEPLGYSFVLEFISDPFTNGSFKKDGLQIDLIWKEHYGLGTIFYGNGEVSISHDDIMGYFKLSKRQKLFYDKAKQKSYSHDGRDLLDAIISDIKLLSSDFLAVNKATINHILKDAYHPQQVTTQT
jgi:hypothetical protein